MKLAGWDSETHLIKPGMMAPRLVCVSWDDGKDRFVLNRTNGLKLMRHAVRQVDSGVIAHNASYDLGVLAAEEASVLPSIFDGFREGRIIDTIVRQKLLDVALGMRKFRRVDGVTSRTSYGLDDLVALYFKERLEKIDTWRLKYALLDGVPVEEWPADARDYALMDATWARRIYEAQEIEIVDCFGELPNQVEQQCTTWALHLMSMWGIRTEEAAVDRFIANCEEKIAQMREDLEGTNIFKPNGSRTMAEIRRRIVESLERQGVQVPMTDPSAKFPDGQVQTDKNALLMTDDPALHVLAESMTYQKHLDQWGPVLRAGVHRNVCARYNSVMETGRVSCSGSEGQEGTNFANPPRGGDVRSAVVPRRGWLFGFADADTIELRAHAQNSLDMFGWSKMAEALIEQHRNGGPDLHETLAGTLLGVDAKDIQARIRAGDEEATDARQFAKIPNFGFPGGLGAPTFVAYAAAQLKRKDFLKWFSADRNEAVAKAVRHREAWFAAWPENREYFRAIGDMIDRDKGYGTIRQLKSGRIRGEVRFTAAANGFFQARVADAMNESLFRHVEECYTGRCTSKHQHGGSELCTHEGRSILYGSRVPLFLYDETGCEHPEDGTESDRVTRQAQINVESLSGWLPDIPCTSSGVLMRRWTKGAKQVRIGDRIVPARPKKVDGKTIWVHDTGAQLAEAA